MRRDVMSSSGYSVSTSAAAFAALCGRWCWLDLVLATAYMGCWRLHGVLATGASAHPIWTSSKVRAVEDCGGRYLLCGLVLTAVADQAAVMRVYFSCVGSEMCSSYRRTALRVP